MSLFEYSFNQWTIGLARGPFIFSVFSVPDPSPVCLTSTSHHSKAIDDKKSIENTLVNSTLEKKQLEAEVETLKATVAKVSRKLNRKKRLFVDN